MSLALRIFLPSPETRESCASSQESTDLDAVIRCFAQSDATTAMRLCAILAPGLRWFLARRVDSCQVESLVKLVLIETIEGVRDGRLRDGQQLLSFARSLSKKFTDGKGNRRTNGRTPARNEVNRVKAALAGSSEVALEALARIGDGESGRSLLADLPEVGDGMDQALRSTRRRHRVADPLWL